MSRRPRVFKKSIVPDLVYSSHVITKLINKVMLDGKKHLAEKIVYNSIYLASEKLKIDKKDVIFQAIENCSPNIEVKAKRLGGSVYQVPSEVSAERRLTLAIRWLVNSARLSSSKNGINIVKALSTEIANSFNNTGDAVKKRDEIYRTAEANRAFSHFKRY